MYGKDAQCILIDSLAQFIGDKGFIFKEMEIFISKYEATLQYSRTSIKC